jgi:branched-chain amino acid aminotransferase
MSDPQVMPDNAYADGAAFIDGEYIPVGEARISILDWGFVRSDVTYDVVAVWGGKFFRLDAHLDRFFLGLGKLQMSCPHDRGEVAAILSQCVRLAGLENAYVKLTLTRGMPPPGSRDPRKCENRFHAYAIPYVWIADLEKQETGLDLTVSTVPRISPDSVDPTVKNFHWGDLVKGLFEAYDRGGETAVLHDGAGNVTEGPGFNLFVCKGGRLLTPADGVLLGITRMTVIELAQSLNTEVIVAPVSEIDLRAADEVFISSTAGGVMPITKLDGVAIGDGAPGPLTTRLKQLYWDAHDDPRYATPV